MGQLRRSLLVALSAALIGTVSILLIPEPPDEEPERGCTWLAGDLDALRLGKPPSRRKS